MGGGGDYSDNLCAIIRLGAVTTIQKGTSYNLIPVNNYETIFVTLEKLSTLKVTGGLYGTMTGYKKDGTSVTITASASPQTIDISEFVYIVWAYSGSATGRTYVFN